jgi:hypothetical protein
MENEIILEKIQIKNLIIINFPRIFQMSDSTNTQYQHIFIEAIPEVDHIAPMGKYLLPPSNP